MGNRARHLDHCERSVAAVTDDRRLCVGDNPRFAIGGMLFFGVVTLSIVGGLVAGHAIVAKLLLLAVMAPMFVLFTVRAVRRPPVLILDEESIVDGRTGAAVRWTAVVEASVREWRGTFGVYHRLTVSGAGAQGPTADAEVGTTSRVAIDSIDRLSLPWREIASQVEARLPSTVTLRREPKDAHSDSMGA
jgi:hypothetical protein